MAERWLPIWGTVGAAYGLGFRSVLRFPVTMLAVSAVLLGINSYTVPICISGILAAQPLLVLVNAFLRAIVLAPFAILIHRSIILHEHSETYWAIGTHRRVGPFIAVTVLLVFVEEVAGFVSALDRYSRWFIVPGLACSIASIIFGIRLCLAFPAIATDQSQTPVRDSFRYVRGSALAIFFVSFFIGLCWMPVGIPLFFADRLSLFAKNDGLLLALRSVQQVLSTFVVAVYVAMASQLWRTRQDWSAAAAPPVAATA